MEFTIITNVTSDDLPNVQRILADLGIGGSVLPTSTPVPNVEADAVVVVDGPSVAPSAPQFGGSDPAAAARAARTFYAEVAQAIGQSRLDDDQRATAKALRKQGATVEQVAQAIGRPTLSPEQERMAALEAELASLRGESAPQSAPQAAPQPTAAAASGASKLSSMPNSGLALSESARRALVDWANTTLAHPARKQVVKEYAQGVRSWADCESVGVKAKSALRVIATHA